MASAGPVYPMNFLTSIFSAIGGFFGWAGQRSAQRNAPAMQANAAARTDAAEAAQATRTVASATNPADSAALERLRRAAAE